MEANVESKARNWFVVLNAATIVLFVAHLVEDQLRGFLTAQLWTIVVPLVAALVIGTAYAYMRHLTGVGMALAVDLWLVVVMDISHINPASAESLGDIVAFWGGGAGYFAATLALALWLVAVAALAEGVWAVARLEPRRARRGTPT